MAQNKATELRDAQASDALNLAKLIDIAGEGIPHWLWGRSCGTNQSPLEIGMERARRTEGGFSFKNAVIAERDDRVIAMVLSYAIDGVDDTLPDDLPAPLIPFVELEMQSANTWYINALAVFPGVRGQGIGAMLLNHAEMLARRSGYKQMSIQVYSQNTGAIRLYERLGYVETARAGVREHPCQPYYDEDVMLLIKTLEN